MSQKNKVLLSLSGGVDSSTLLAHFVQKGYDVAVVSFLYGSKHGSYENKAAKAVADYYYTNLEYIDLSFIMSNFRSNLMKLGGDIPEGHYEDKNMVQTVVPGRNIIFSSILTGIAWSNDIPEIALGIHQGDHAIYPDCRPDFYSNMNKAIRSGTNNKVKLIAPFLHLNKGQIVELGLQYKVPYELTRTCYKDQELACGKCGACTERLEAFALNKASDPLRYENETD